MLAYKFKIPGMIMVLAGTTLACLYFLIDLRFEVPILAVVSSYMETKFFTVFKTNFADETILLLLLTGLSFWAFSKEKYEDDSICLARKKALKRTILSYTGILFFTVLFIYGGVFIGMLIVNIILPFILYLLFFHILRRRIPQLQ